MDGTTHSSGPRPATWRARLVIGAVTAAIVLGGCVQVSTNVTPPPAGSPTLNITPPPTATPEPEVTPEPEATPQRTRRPRTPKPTAPATPTPKPTKKPTPQPTATDTPTTPPTATPAMTTAPGATPTATPMANGWPGGAYDTTQAADHVGEAGTVCGTVVAAQYMPNAPGRPTFLNIDQPYPNQTFNVVIWGEQRRRFPLARKPEVNMLGKVVCTTGDITAYVDWTQIAYADRQGTKIIP